MSDLPPLHGVLSPEVLASQGQSLRRLATRLLGDEHQAEDAVQEAWLTAIESPPRRQGALSWLRVVTQNVSLTMHRSRDRRRRRELSVALHEALPATDEVVARGDLLQTVAGAVMALSEPYRSTLLLRYYEGLETAQVAEIQGVSPATVRSRVHRAIGQLRERLDEHRTWGERRWVRALAPLVGLPSSLQLSQEAAVGSGLGVLGASALLTVGVGGAVLTAWWALSGSPEPVNVAASTRDVEWSVPADPVLPERTTLPAVEIEALPATVAGTRERPYRLRGLVVNEAREPVANARVEYRLSTGALAEVRRTDASGGFEILDAEPFPSVVARASRLGSSGLYAVQFTDHEADVVLTLGGGGADVHGTVVDAAGLAVEGALIRIGSRVSRYGLETVGDDDASVQPAPAAIVATGAEGRFVAEGIPAGTHAVVAFRSGCSPWYGSVEVGDRDEWLNITLGGSASLSGFVSDVDGRPVANAWVGLSPSDPLFHFMTYTDASGAYRLEGIPVGRFRVVARTETHFDETTMKGVGPGDALHWNAELQAGSQLHVRVQDGRGGGLEGWLVEVDWRRPEPDARPKDLRARLFRSSRRTTDEDGWIHVTHPIEDMGAHVNLIGPHRHWPVLQDQAELERVGEEPVVFTVADPLPPAHMLEFSVEELGAGPDPIDPPWQLYLLHAGSGRWSVPPLVALGEGLFEVGPLPEGDYEVLAAFTELGQASLGPWKVQGTAERLAMGAHRIPRAGALELEWTAGEPPPRVIQVRPLLSGTASPEPAMTLSLADGRTSARLFPGQYQLEVATGQALSPMDFEIRPGEATRIRVSFQQADGP